MHRPVLVTPPAILPVTLEEARRFVIVEAEEDGPVLEAMLEAAAGMFDGWNGVLGRCLVEQEWRQDFDRFESCLPLPLLPVMSISSVTYLGEDGGTVEVDPDRYSLVTDAGGISYVVFRDMSVGGPVSITYKAGYVTAPKVPADGDTPAIPARSTVPAPIKTAICMLVAQWFNSREATVTGTIATELPLAVDALITPYKVRRL
ncbi:head-tail connector protein [Shinella daejeonensis]|uniref:head-tail connector protein n=1 Tax=Shinella daejeonensis TaxID=659017 RepID=UPI0020C75D3B|nr:head-tail connector protein [Shinella daejeonensis]MCP8894293.1 head-tail connector protein [Shinella daejeonensis]